MLVHRMFLLPIIILLDDVILASLAREPVAPVQSLKPQPPTPTLEGNQFLPQPAAPIDPTPLTVPQIPPTKPPMVHLLRTTLAQDDSMASTSFIPAGSMITMDVSLPPTPITSAPQLSPISSQQQPAQNITSFPASGVNSETANNASTSSPTLLQPDNNEATNSSHEGDSPAGLGNEATSITAAQSSTPTISFNDLPLSTQAPVSTTTTFIDSVTKPTNRPQSSQAQESRRLSDNSTTISNASQSNSPPNASVQFLKAKIKFKCNQNGTDCLNGGMCFHGACFCAPGFTGANCSINIDECRQIEEPCYNNGICIDEENQFRCECAPGFKGERCQELNDMCSNSPCLNGAKCIDHRTDYTCTCEPGWNGKQCEINIDDCSKNPCQNNGTCYDLINDYNCDCGSSGFTGKNCDVNFDDCASLPCGPAAKECNDLINDFHCVCHDGFTGHLCEIDVDECETNFGSCQNGASCENFHGGHRCNCKEGFRGEKCQEISDYCKAKQPCITGTCKNVNRSQEPYRCECPSSHFGKQCERKRDCLNECHNQHGRCINNVTCACLPGRRDERIMCEYVASCEQVEGTLCLNGGICKNSETSGYQCLCQEPFYGPVCQFVMEKPPFDLIQIIVAACVALLLFACAVVFVVVFRSVRKARATRGTYSPSTQEKFGNSASDLLKPPIPERLI